MTEGSLGSVVFHVDIRPWPKKSKRTHNLFDSLVRDLEGDQTQETATREARHWIAANFYDGKNTLASLRLAVGLSQKELGEHCDIAQPHISRYETGRHAPSIDIAHLMANALKVDLNVFYEAWTNTAAMAKANESTK